MRKKHDESAARRAPATTRRSGRRRAGARPRLLDAPRRATTDAAAAPAQLRRVHRPDQGRREPQGLRAPRAQRQAAGRSTTCSSSRSPPGIGKTTLAHLIAHALGVPLRAIGAPRHRAQRHARLVPDLAVRARRLLHRRGAPPASRSIEEYLYPAMEDFRLEIPVGDGPNAEMLPIKLPRFSLVAATTRTGLLVGAVLCRPLRHRAPARVLHAGRAHRDRAPLRAPSSASCIEAAGAKAEIGRRARGTPRIANHLLKRVRDFAEVESDGTHHRRPSRRPPRSSGKLGVDQLGLDGLDRSAIAHHHREVRRAAPSASNSRSPRRAPRSATHARGRVRAVPHPGGACSAHAARSR